MKSAYLLINLLTVLFPLVLSFDKRVRFYKSWKNILPGLFISGLLFLIWDHLFTVLNVWTFNTDYILGIYIWQLPLEEILFFITVPFACIFIYECLNYYIKRDILARISRAISILLMLVSVICLTIFYDRVYTLITFSLLLLVLVYAEFQQKVNLGRFYTAYLISLIPFYIVNGILTSIPIVVYNNTENIGFRIGTIPFEDHFYSMCMLMMNIMLFEYFKKKGAVQSD